VIYIPNDAQLGKYVVDHEMLDAGYGGGAHAGARHEGVGPIGDLPITVASASNAASTILRTAGLINSARASPTPRSYNFVSPW
jgi:hypothetical protein